MPKKDTVHMGDVGEMFAAAELLRRGYKVSRPLSNGIPYDLIIDTAERLLRVQVKRAREKEGRIKCKLSSTAGGTYSLYAGKVDLLIVVDCENMKFYGFAGADLDKQEVWLRTGPTGNGQSVGVRPATDYYLDRYLPDRGLDGEDDALA